MRIYSICIEAWTPSPTLQTQISQEIWHFQPPWFPPKGNQFLSREWHDVQAQHQFLWKTWGWFTCRSLRKSYTTNYVFKSRNIDIITLNTTLRSTEDGEPEIFDLHCPHRKGIIYYHRDGAIFEYNIHSSGKHEVNSHVAHWESHIQLTMLSSHESLSRNIHRGVWQKCRSSPSKAIGSYYSQRT